MKIIESALLPFTLLYLHVYLTHVHTAGGWDGAMDNGMEVGSCRDAHFLDLGNSHNVQILTLMDSICTLAKELM